MKISIEFNLLNKLETLTIQKKEEEPKPIDLWHLSRHKSRLI